MDSWNARSASRGASWTVVSRFAMRKLIGALDRRRDLLSGTFPKEPSMPRRRASLFVLGLALLLSPSLYGRQQPPPPTTPAAPPTARRAGGGARRRTGRAGDQVARGRRRWTRDVPAPRAEREGSRRQRRGQQPADAEGRARYLDRHVQPVHARYLHVFARGGRHVAQRPEQPPGSDELQRISIHVCGPRSRSVAARCRRAEGRHRAPPVSFGHRQRRPGLLRLHACGLRRPPGEGVSRALSSARPR